MASGTLTVYTIPSDAQSLIFTAQPSYTGAAHDAAPIFTFSDDTVLNGTGTGYAIPAGQGTTIVHSFAITFGGETSDGDFQPWGSIYSIGGHGVGTAYGVWFALNGAAADRTVSFIEGAYSVNVNFGIENYFSSTLDMTAGGDLEDDNRNYSMVVGAASLAGATYATATDGLVYASGLRVLAAYVAPSAGGDPYIMPRFGSIYKLPNINAFYRLYEKEDVFINAQVKEAGFGRKEKIIEYYSKKGLEDVNKLVVDGYFFKAFFISVGTHKLAIDLDTIKWITTNHSREFFKIKKPTARKLTTQWGGTETISSMKICWDHEVFGKMGIDLHFYRDPQKENGISLITNETVGARGLLIRNYRPKLMQIPKLTTLKCKKIENKLKKTRKLFTNKPIKGKNEIWKKM